ncbi:uncharacterized protein BYT42DRAFT_572326 [Radiomyces spectabilis]|uniref:uncharacterized protein n=1 Tax=Radiomyces spectabilis TaxID=64574 RepID=UPI00221F30AF|nr:uncharacterized protein BYT42DRAFT_572326 [Radiomyces spectabilis]KAI8377961.1 hypothetical protein BYT42DRAFT_572326 [Radiomyces spectabilis]
MAMVSSALGPDASKSRKRSSSRSYKESKSSRYERKLKKIKLKVRSEIDLFDWQKWRFHERDYWISPFVDVVPRIDYRKMSKSEFIDKYEAKNVPVVITHATDHWKAANWSEEYLLEQYGSHLFKVGEDDDENNVYMKMKHFLHYCKHEGKRDDSPLYIFDSGFYKDRRKRAQTSSSNDEDDDNLARKKQKADSNTKSTSGGNGLMNEYQVPSYFADDLFRWTGERRRPPYRWLVMGGARSGTGIHTDPLGTSAWNALLKGHKRWCLFPPGTPKHIIDPPMKPYDHEGVSWFTKVFPKFQVRDDLTDNRTLGEKLGMVEVLQRPGETIFVPGGWAHVVINLDMTIAVTQNFCSLTNAEYVYLCTRHSRPKLGAKLFNKIQKLGELYPKEFGDTAAKLRTLICVPQIPPSSSGSSSSSSSSSSFTSSSDMDLSLAVPARPKKLVVSSTESETDLSDGTCMCHKCKRRRKKQERKRMLKNGLV